VAATSKENGAATFDGADGVVWSREVLRDLDQHHPVCADKEASQFFFHRAAPPPQLRRGAALPRRFVKLDRSASKGQLCSMSRLFSLASQDPVLYLPEA
jgi:hypothetical protein